MVSLLRSFASSLPDVNRSLFSSPQDECHTSPSPHVCEHLNHGWCCSFGEVWSLMDMGLASSCKSVKAELWGPPGLYSGLSFLLSGPLICEQAMSHAPVTRDGSWSLSQAFFLHQEIEPKNTLPPLNCLLLLVWLTQQDTYLTPRKPVSNPPECLLHHQTHSTLG